MLTVKKVYELLEQKKKETNWEDLKSIQAYNEYARNLRSQLEWQLDKDC